MGGLGATMLVILANQDKTKRKKKKAKKTKKGTRENTNDKK